MSETRDDLPDPQPFEGQPLERSVRVYDSPWVSLRRDLLRLPDGAQQEYHVVEISDAVVVVPRLPDGRVVMIWQHRHPHGKTHWEVPAGRLQVGEDPAAAAERELLEETGHRPGRLLRLPGFYPINGISAHWAHAFLALDCERVSEPALDVTEQIETGVFSAAHVRGMLAAGELDDGFTALALFYAFTASDDA
ncbi:MAG: NUDIX hydrolase [Planctomycetota bacterium]|nr:MAG: NUDIX hydrolase [Planctomycetota bacterium]